MSKIKNCDSLLGQTIIMIAIMSGCKGDLGDGAPAGMSASDSGIPGAPGDTDSGESTDSASDADDDGTDGTGSDDLPGYDDFHQHCDDPHPGHADDEHKEDEHQALLALFPTSDEPGVVEAVEDGSWFSPQTWSTGEVPHDGARVLIPCGRVIWYDEVSEARIDRVGVEGILHFHPHVDTKLVTDTLLTAPHSVLTIGINGVPVRHDARAEIIIHRDQGPIDRSTDPELLTRGIVSHGTARIQGHDKADFLRIASARAGDDELVFTDEPTGWQVGDKLVVAAAHNEIVQSTQKEISTYQDEVVTIRAISNTGQTYRVSLDQTLAYDHVPPHTASGRTLTIPVANYTRNVFVGTETEADAYLGNGLTVPIAERGHVMFMHSRDVVVENAEFFELGRTDKKIAFSDENVAGRYTLHFHRNGVLSTNKPAHAEGNAIWGSPGWGIVHHDSHLDVLSNAVFGVVGSGIVAEAGNETGEWSRNIVIQTTGTVRSFNAQIQGGPNVETEAAYQAEVENNSFLQGEAYGMKSRLLQLHDNVAVSANGAGFSFWPHGTDGPSHIGAAASDFEHVEGYDPYYGQPAIYPGRVATRHFTGNEVIASRHALNTSANKIAHRSDLDILIEDLLSWNVDQAIISYYQENYIIKDSVFIRGTGNTHGFYYNGTDGNTHSSASHIHDPTDFKLVNNYFEGYDVAAKEPIQFILGNTVVGSSITEQTGPAGIFREGYTADNDTIDVLDNSDGWRDNLANPAGTLHASIDLGASTLRMEKSTSFFSVMVDKTDSLGEEHLEMGAPVGKRFRFAKPADLWPAVTAQDGYYKQADGTIYMVIHIVVGDRLTGSAGILPVAIELAFLQGSTDDLPQGAIDNGPLPADLAATGVGTFTVVDMRSIDG